MKVFCPHGGVGQQGRGSTLLTRRFVVIPIISVSPRARHAVLVTAAPRTVGRSLVAMLALAEAFLAPLPRSIGGNFGTALIGGDILTIGFVGSLTLVACEIPLCLNPYAHALSTFYFLPLLCSAKGLLPTASLPVVLTTAAHLM